MKKTENIIFCFHEILQKKQRRNRLFIKVYISFEKQLVKSKLAHSEKKV